MEKIIHLLKESKMEKKCLLLCALLISPSSFAFFCPTNFNQINFGDSIEQVIQQCGKPDNQTGSIMTDDSKVPQEWDYYISQSVSSFSMTPMQGTLKTAITFDGTGKAISMMVNGIGVGSSTICNGNTVQLGDTQETVKKACGTPSFISKQTSAEPLPQIVVSIITYNTNPPVILKFENGKLTEKQ